MSSTPPPSSTAGTSSASRAQPAPSAHPVPGPSNGFFEKQRDLLVQEISNSIDSVVYNLDMLNRSLNESIQVGKEFDDVGRLWSHFYDGQAQVKARKGETEEAEEDTTKEKDAPVSFSSDEDEAS